MGQCIGKAEQILDDISKPQQQGTHQQQQAAWPQQTPQHQAAYPPQQNGAVAYASQQKHWVEVLFFPDPNFPCRNWARNQNCNRPNCNFAHQTTSLARLLQHLGNAKKSLDVCVFTITCDDIADALLDAHRRGVRVRIITDDEQSKTQGSDVVRLAQAGIAVVDDRSQYHMHHKFAIVDGAVVCNGSFNWTRQAVIGNQENVMVTNDPAAVAAFGRHFEQMWSQFSRNVVR